MKTLVKNLHTFLIFVVFIILSEFAGAQVDPQIQRYRNDSYGKNSSRKHGIIDGNLIRTLFRNDGQIGYWEDRPSMEWPKGTGHCYSDGYALLVSAAVTAPGNGQIIHPVQTSYRENIDKDSLTGDLWIFQPIPNYCRTSSVDYPAVSHLPSTWPLTWPVALGLDSTWNGHWYGYFGKDNFYPTTETFFAMDDSRDREWTRQPYSYFPVLSDTNRGGLGLRVESRIFQWNNIIVEDILFINYDIINISDFDYPQTCFGFYTDLGVGGLSDGGDEAGFIGNLNLAYGYDSDGISNDPPPSWIPGYIGYTFLDSPVDSQDQLMNSLSTFHISNVIGNALRDDEAIWQKMSYNQIDTSINYSNIGLIAGSGPFNFPKWTTEKFVIAMIMGENLNDLILNKTVAKIVYDSNYVIPDSISYVDSDPLESVNNFDLMQNYPNPFNPTTTIIYNVPFTSNIRIVVYDILGTEIKTLMNEEKIKGEYQLQFDATGLSSGVYYYSIFANDFAQTKKMILIK